MAKPGFFFYPGDWFKKTRALTLEARGAWIDALGLMNELNPRGILSMTIEQYGRFWGCGSETALAILIELQMTNVADIDPQLNDTFLDELSTGSSTAQKKEDHSIDSQSCNVTKTLRVTLCRIKITLSSRRMVREDKFKESNRLRQQRFREQQTVTAEYKPSSSSSSSSSSKNKKENKEKKEKKSAESSPSGFDCFWKQFPNKTAKGQAKKAWIKLNPSQELQDHILEAIKKQVEWRRNRDPNKFTPEWKHPATWLNGECWEDELPEPEQEERPEWQKINLATLK